MGWKVDLSSFGLIKSYQFLKEKSMRIIDYYLFNFNSDIARRGGRGRLMPGPLSREDATLCREGITGEVDHSDW